MSKDEAINISKQIYLKVKTIYKNINANFYIKMDKKLQRFAILKLKNSNFSTTKIQS